MVLAFSVTTPARVQARLLQLGGSIELGYGQSRTKGETFDSSTSTFDQRYNLGATGDVGRLGNYRADATWFDERLSPDNTEDTRFIIKDYRVGVNLLPTISPLSLQAERIDRSTETTETSDETITIYSANWLLDLRSLPRLNFNAQRSVLDTGSGPELETNTAGVQADGTIQDTRLAAAYQYSHSDFGPGGTRTHGLNLNVSTQLTANLLFNGDARYSSSRTPATVISPGINVFQERSIGLSLSYRPPLYWWDASTAYNYTENPFFEDFKSHVLQGNANLRPSDRIDSAANARLLRFSVESSEVQALSGDLAANYRPTFGINTGAGVAAGRTDTESSSGDTDTFFHNYRGNIAYYRSLERFQYRAGYNVGLGFSDTDPGVKSTDLANTVSVGADNTNTEIIHVGMDATYSNVQRKTGDEETEQNTVLVVATAESSYFRSLLLRGDQLTLRSSVSASQSSGFGIAGRTVLFDALANYNIRQGLFAAAGYAYDDYPTEVRLDRQTYFVQGGYTAYVLQYMSLTLSGKQTWEDNRYQTDVARSELNAGAVYQLGLFTLRGDYLLQITDLEDGIGRITSQLWFVRATRTF